MITKDTAINFRSEVFPYGDLDPNDPRVILFSGVSTLKNGNAVSTVVLLSYPDGSYLTKVNPNISGQYSFYLVNSQEYIFVFIGQYPYKPEAYYYKATS